jgi:hypothetical protein
LLKHVLLFTQYRPTGSGIRGTVGRCHYVTGETFSLLLECSRQRRQPSGASLNIQNRGPSQALPVLLVRRIFTPCGKISKILGRSWLKTGAPALDLNARLKEVAKEVAARMRLLLPRKQLSEKLCFDLKLWWEFDAASQN